MLAYVNKQLNSKNAHHELDRLSKKAKKKKKVTCGRTYVQINIKANNNDINCTTRNQ